MTGIDGKSPLSSNITRRGFIGAGAATAAGALLPSWSWAASSSIVGVGGTTTPPWDVWDPEADAVIAGVIERGETARVNELLKGWKKNGQPLPAGLPNDVRAFIEKARQLPAWVDKDKLKRVDTFNKNRGTYLGVAYGFVSGMMSTVIPNEAHAVYYSRGGANMKRRIARTARFGYDMCTIGGWVDPNMELIPTVVKTRMAHAGVRHMLPKSSYWQAASDQQKPISQRDILVTWHSLPTSVMRAFKQWGVKLSASESDAFLHHWQIAAHMLGVNDEYIPATWDGAYAQAKEILDPVIAPTEEGKKLAGMLLNLAANVDGAILSRPLLESLTRYFLGDKIADWLGINRNPFDIALGLAWPNFVFLKEFGLAFPGSSEFYWFFDEILRQGVLLFMSDLQPINIEIPDTNNPNLR